MGKHLTPSDRAKESRLDRRDVIAKCVEWGVPIFNGKIDKTLFHFTMQEFTDVSSGQTVTV